MEDTDKGARKRTWKGWLVSRATCTWARVSYLGYIVVAVAYSDFVSDEA